MLEALVKVNRDLGAATAIITHNAGIRKIAHRVIHLADARVARIEENATRIAPSQVAW